MKKEYKVPIEKFADAGIAAKEGSIVMFQDRGEGKLKRATVANVEEDFATVITDE